MRQPKYKVGDIVIQKAHFGWKRRIIGVIHDYSSNYGNRFGYVYEQDDDNGNWLRSPWTIGENSLLKWINK